MIVSLIAAMTEDRVIGRGGKLPWNIPADLTRFRTITMGHTLVMGRKTYQSIGRPLPGRRNVVLTSTLQAIEGCEIVHSLQEAIAAAEGEEEIFICGGGEVFREALPLSQRIYLTIIHENYEGDVYFPAIPETFQELRREERADLTPPISFVLYEKIAASQPGTEVEELRKKGREALQRQLYFLARSCFEEALSIEDNAEDASDLAFCLAKGGGDMQAALWLAEKSLERHPDAPRFYLNLGRIEILAGEKEKGLDTLRKGMQLGGAAEIQAELAILGPRTPPPIRALRRNHPLNRYLGLVLNRMGLR